VGPEPRHWGKYSRKQKITGNKGSDNGQIDTLYRPSGVSENLLQAVNITLAPVDLLTCLTLASMSSSDDRKKKKKRLGLDEDVPQKTRGGGA